MPSHATNHWRGAARVSLDEIEAAHRAVGGVGRGRRYATSQLNQAYAVLLSAQFQRFCRSLHSEAADAVVSTVTPPAAAAILRLALAQHRKLDQGNPNPGNIGGDFNRFDFLFWDEVYLMDPRNQSRRQKLESLAQWRNAIAHQDFAALATGAALNLAMVREWRTACDKLAASFDEVIRNRVAAIIGRLPW